LAFAAALFAWLHREAAPSTTAHGAVEVHELVPADPQVPVATVAEPTPAPTTSVEPPSLLPSEPKHKKPIRRKPAADTPAAHGSPPPADYETSATERRK